MDGKLFAEGSKGEHNGDVDLWGIEKPVMVGVALKIRDEMIATTKDLDKPLEKKPNRFTCSFLAKYDMSHFQANASLTNQMPC